MRIMIKGGVWKNTEDEILKAAVMKYGLNQWARISSLLVRKSAKQCKARWYEWLDPSIKKTEWTREEDEKLLHLAKLMPTQWRTIAPIVGRTPAQCLERYEKLLDAAAAKDDTYDPADDPRRLRPGEIDPNPESKPARPDPIDMDEDEKEMLSEARARLANTRGKKAKRKAREKQLEEARRLAALQKKRELKAAGIEMREKARRRRGIDYNAEVAFEKAPARGFFDVAEERELTAEVGREFRPQTLEQLEGKRRKDIEQGLMKKDVERDKIRDRHNRPDAVAHALQLNEAAGPRRRGKMMLPAPQVSEAELEQIARGGAGGAAADLEPELAGGAGGEVTRRLLGDYQTPQRMATPMRTPRVLGAGGQDRIMQEAQNLARLQQGQTPLVGGENPELHPSDFSGITPKPFVAPTPNPLATGLTPAGHTTSRAIAGIAATPAMAGATPAMAGATPAGPSVAGTPLRSVAGTPLRTPGGPSATPMRTPLRDELGLNDPDLLSAADSKRAERQRIAAMRSELKAGLAGLPAPRNEYQIVVPELPEDDPLAALDEEPGYVEDAADAAARKKAAAKAREEAELRKRSSVLQRGLPRPLSLAAAQLPALRPEDEVAALPMREAAEELLNREMILLLQHDATAHPVKERKRRREGPGAAAAPLEEVDADLMAAARSMLERETHAVRAAMGHAGVAPEEYADAWGVAARDLIYLPAQQRYNRAASATNSDRLASVQGEYEAVRKEMEKEAVRAAKLEQKANVLTRGLLTRAATLRQAGEALSAQITSQQSELLCFRALAAQEARAAPARRAELQRLIAEQREREAELQDRYKELSRQQADLSQQQQQLVAVAS